MQVTMGSTGRWFVCVCVAVSSPAAVVPGPAGSKKAAEPAWKKAAAAKFKHAVPKLKHNDWQRFLMFEKRARAYRSLSVAVELCCCVGADGLRCSRA